MVQRSPWAPARRLATSDSSDHCSMATPLAASRPFFDRIAGPKELVILENCGHIPIEEPGQSTLRAAVAGFLQKVL